MTTLLATGNRRGVVLSPAIQIPASWIGEVVAFTLTTRGADIRNPAKSFDLRIQVAAEPVGPWEPHGGCTWESSGANMVDKFDRINTSTAYSFQVEPDLSGSWLRVDLDVPETMRIGVDAEMI